MLTGALAIGVNTATFSVVNSVMLRPLPFVEPERLVWVAERNDRLSLPTFAASALNYLSWKEQARSLEPLGAIGFASFNLSGEGDPEQFSGGRLTRSVFPLLGLEPVAGRAFQEGEDEPGSPPVAQSARNRSFLALLGTCQRGAAERPAGACRSRPFPCSPRPGQDPVGCLSPWAARPRMIRGASTRAPVSGPPLADGENSGSHDAPLRLGAPCKGSGPGRKVRGRHSPGDYDC